MAEAQLIAAFTNLFEVVAVKPEISAIYLELDSSGLAVMSPAFGKLYVRQIYAKLSGRYNNVATDLLIQAVKTLPKSSTAVWDLTAGLARDALLLASNGYQVTMVEQHPLLVTIIHYALTKKIIPEKNLRLVWGNSIEFLTNTSIVPNVIYLDFMFNDNKSAKAKKEMQLIQLLNNKDNTLTDNELFNLCYKTTVDKIIVKRENKHKNSPNMPKPTYVKQGKTIRFDVYSNGLKVPDKLEQ